MLPFLFEVPERGGGNKAHLKCWVGAADGWVCPNGRLSCNRSQMKKRPPAKTPDCKLLLQQA
eukprot:scaffold82677_cov20-Tisochrysis_lutea.AAC.4